MDVYKKMVFNAEVSVGINSSLLVDSTQALDRAYIESILTEEVSGIESLDMGFFLLFFLPEIAFGDDRIIRVFLGIKESSDTMFESFFFEISINNTI